MAEKGKEKKGFKGADEKARELYEQLKAGLEGFLTSEGFRAWLEVQTKFHRYSFYNTMLILLQRPSATRVAGYRKWQEMGRQVRRGEKGIAIFAPVTKTVRETVVDENGLEVEEVREVLLGFKVVYVFDISQTDGKPLPELETKAKGGSAEALELAAKLERLAAGMGLAVVEEDTGRADGYFDRWARKIAVKRGLNPNHRAKVLAHEVAHALLHERRDERVSREQGEVEAEAVAYIVCTWAGVQVEESSLAYIGSWTWRKPEQLMEAGERIQGTASRIIAALEAEAKVQEKAA